MKTTMDRLSEQVESVEDRELVELGDVSRETKGGPTGNAWDGGAGWLWME